MLAMTVFSFSQNPPAAGAPAGAPAGANAAGGGQNQNRGAGGNRGGGRGGAAAPAEPTPRLPDGTVNLGRTPSDVDGMWSLPYIQNMASAQYFVGAPAAAGGGGNRGGGGGAAAGGGNR